MEKQKINPKLTDRLLIGGMILPIAVGWLLKILLIPAAEGVEITGAHIFITLPLPFGGLPITETQVNQWLVMISLYFVCRYLTRGLKKIPDLKRQHLAEWIVEQTEKLVKSNMGEYFADFAPFIGAILGLSAFSSLLSLTGLFPPTSDLNVTAGWAILVFFLITYYKMKCGPIRYLKSFAEPVPFLAPLNVISEFATPVSMAFRHYGNILSGTVISVGEIPLFRIGLPAVFSVYFDIFSGCLQAFIFAMLTMLYVAGGFPAEDYFNKQKLKMKKASKKLIKNSEVI